VKQVTIEEARKILGDEAVKMSDDELQILIDDLSVMAKWALEKQSIIGCLTKNIHSVVKIT